MNVAVATPPVSVSAPKLSATSKLGCLSWSLQALETCPGSVGVDGELVPACSGCYATTGNYVFANVKAPRAHNKEDWQLDGWEDAMVAALFDEEYFRWFDSGDMYAIALAQKMLNVMRRTPWCKHWLPTRMYKFAKFSAVIKEMMALENVMVRPSSDAIDGSYTPGVHGSTIVPDAQTAASNPALFVCGAYSRDGKCGPCRACWDKSVPMIAYPAHGKKMAKVIRLSLAA